MVVQHNISAMNANRLFGINNSGLSKSLEKLSSGYAINRAGDNAAGLAVSEKMRSQIAGLTQGAKNAEDGISMIQTFEGALQETDSILQRMKTLATQAANGTYQNEVDREAIQLEFDQLNDELDQIADTDFNGVVALNGGQMADGTKAINGKFDYANRVRDPKQLTDSDVSIVDYQNAFDDSDTTKGTAANKAWEGLNSNWKRTDAVKTNDGPDSVDISFKYDATGGADGTKFWTATDATNGADINNVTVTNTNNGGFKVTAGGVVMANAVIDTSKLVNGDTVTLTFNNPNAGLQAPTNAGADVASSTFQEGAKTTAVKDSDADLTVTLDNVADKDMTKVLNSIYNALNGATVETNYVANTATAKTDMKITLNDDNKTEITQAGLGGDTKSASVYVNGEKVNIAFDFSTAGTVKVGTAKADGTIDKQLATFAMTTAADTSDSSGKKTYNISIENYNYNTSAVPSVEIKSPKDAAVSKADAYTQATAPLTYTDHVTLQAGARTKDAVDFTFKYSSDGLGNLKANLDCSSRTDGLGTKDLSLRTQEDANKAIDRIDNAINKVSMVRATFGATQNRLEHKIANLNTNNENLTAAESRIRDTDMAKEMTNFTKNQILSQASQAMLAQANQLPQGVLQLLG